MRFFSLALFASLSLMIFATAAGCLGGVAETCFCPATGIWPLVMIALPCGTTTTPTMTLAGVCAGTGGEQSGQLVFGANAAGSCNVELTYADGSTYATDVEFTGQWLACGSNPRGCGEQISPSGLSAGDGVTSVLVAGPQCAAPVLGNGGDASASTDAAGPVATASDAAGE